MPETPTKYPQMLTFLGLFATLLGMSVGVSVWIGRLQADVYTNSRWVEERNRERLPQRVDTIESELAHLEDQISTLEAEIRSFDVRGHERYEDYLRRTQPGPK